MRTRHLDGKWLRSLPEFWVSLALLLAIVVVMMVLVSCQAPLRSY